MPVETATYISGLNASNPANTDEVKYADDHLRLIKSTLLATFPSITGAVTLTHTQLNDAALKSGGNTFTGTQTFSNNVTVGGNASVSGTLGVTGNSTLSGTLSAGASTLSSLTVTNNATVGGTLGVTGLATLASVAISGGTITGITDLAIADGGTGSSTAAGARTNLGLGTAATQNTGTSGANVPLLNTNNTHSGNTTFSGTVSCTSTLGVDGNLTASGNVLLVGALAGVSASATIGYTTGMGAGNAVTQATSRTTGVTINKPCGNITLFSEAGSTTPKTFTVTNSKVGNNDAIILTQNTGSNKYSLSATNTAAGSFDITVYSLSGTTTEAPVINFFVLKGTAT